MATTWCFDRLGKVLIISPNSAKKLIDRLDCVKLLNYTIKKFNTIDLNRKSDENIAELY